MRRRAGDRAQTQPLHCELQHRSIYQAPEDVPEDGPARVLLGSYGSASNAIASPSPINYLAVRLKAGECWRYEPPTGSAPAPALRLVGLE
jgi:hypothetical protein